MKPLLVALIPTVLGLLAMLAAVGLLPFMTGLPHPQPLQRKPGVPGSLNVVVARNAAGRWFADGVAVDDQTLERRLSARGDSLTVRFLPSDRLSTAEVSTSLAWLRRRTKGFVQLELMGG